MAKSLPPKDQYQFGGVVSAGHKLRRPSASCIKCENLRVMDGNWLRLRSGRALKNTIPAINAQFIRFHQFRRSGTAGGVYSLANYFDGQNYQWSQLSLPSYQLTPLESISQYYGYITNSFAPILTQRNRVVWYNGLGVRPTNGSGSSQPAMSSWDGVTVRYVGLDAFCPQGTPPSAAFSPGGGQVTMQFFRTFYVGLYNYTTGHYSNGLLAGTCITPGANGTIVYTNLQNLTAPYHNTTEQGELYYVFYSTLDGATVPYLIQNSDGSGPVRAPVGATSAVIGTGVSTLIVDQTQQMPISNFPPRPVKLMAYGNGRIFYALLANAGSGNPFSDFIYPPSVKQSAAVGWTAAASDSTQRSFTGVPEESFPLNNIIYTPNGEDPVLIESSQDDNRILVCTATGTFLLEEYVDGLMQWRTISWVDGCFSPNSFARTPYGSMWMTQNKELVILQPGQMSLDRVSSEYADLLNTTNIPTACADYILDPISRTDRYQLYLGSGNGTSIVHDFWIGGQAYTETNQNVDACKTLMDSSGSKYSLVGIGGKLCLHEADPSTGNIPTTDEGSEITGTYIGQWMCGADSSVRKEFKHIDVIGDGATSPQLGKPPLAVSWFGDLQSTEMLPVSFKKTNQSPAGGPGTGETPTGTGDSAYRALLNLANRFWFKLKLKMKSHSQDSGATYAYNPTADGDLQPNVYGSVFEVRLTENEQSANRA